MNRDSEVSSPGARGPAYIALSNERGPSDQTDLNRTVFINPLGRWSIIREVEPDWLPPGSIPEYRFSTGDMSVLINIQDRPRITI